MSLSRALTMLPSDNLLESVMRDVLVLISHHAGEWFSQQEVTSRTGHEARDVSQVFEALRRGFVVDFDDDHSAFRYRYDPGVDFEIETFLRRSAVQETHAQRNVARYRERYGGTLG
ncbi:MAG TPA: hypothetical protein VFE45_13325 [Coriobacteriia bacterium]|nr:hypothetical protein [Coriobacteriia bacterium]